MPWTLCLLRKIPTLWVWWLLPFLAARALVPVGFMAQPDARGDLRIVICTVGAPQLLDADQSTTARHDNSSHWQHDQSCPFGHAATAPIVHLSGGIQIIFVAAPETPEADDPPYLAAGPPRILTNRGPPTHV